MLKSISDMEENISSIQCFVASNNKLFCNKLESFDKKMGEIQEDAKKIEALIDKVDSILTDENKDLEDEDYGKKFMEELVRLGVLQEVQDDSSDDNEDVAPLVRQYVETKIQKKFLLNNAIVYGITCYEMFISKILSNYYREHNESLDGKSLSITEIKKFGDFKTAYEYLIADEVTANMYKSTSQQMDIIEKFLNVKNTHFHENKVKMNEIFLRRNIIIHNNGIVNSIYIKESSNPYKFSLDEEIVSSEEYVNDSLDFLLIDAILLYVSIWKKTKGDMKEIDSESSTAIEKIAFKFLCREKWEYAKNIYESLYESKRISDYEFKMFYLNILLCRRQLQEAEAETLIAKLDYDACDDFLKLGAFALQKNYKAIKQMIKKLVDTPHQITSKEIMRWPIFKDLRNDETALADVLRVCGSLKTKHYILK